MNNKNIIDFIEKNAFFQSNEFIPGKTQIKISGKIYDQNELLLGIQSIINGWWTEGEFNKMFISKFSSFLGIKHVLPVNSGSSANLLAFAALTSPLLKEKRIKKGDEVITVASCFPTTVNPILLYGCIPVFVDVNLETYNADCDLIENAITQKTKAIFLAHTLGNPINLDKIQKICKKYDLWLIEDCCDALGSEYGGKKVGTFGDIGTFSFYPAHHITAGEGGAAATNNDLLNKIMKSIRDWGRDCFCETGHDNTCQSRFCQNHGELPQGYDHKYVYSNMGFNLKWTDFQASIACAQMDKLDFFIKKRKENFNLLHKGLKKFEKHLILPKEENNSNPSWFGFLLTVKPPINRNDLIEHLENSKISTRLLFAGNVTKQPYFKDLKYRICGNLKNTDIIMNSSFWIGVYPGITPEIIDYILMKFEDFFKKSEK
ncbi:MAG: lipopolysaccharide biosynthesis protein RfbH [Candidatus Nanoarchaeia archaeon]|nr:lipopolysaccharide biosynthesis protein RfbH [Candidatus Nanoarchaeia archaeon]